VNSSCVKKPSTERSNFVTAALSLGYLERGEMYIVEAEAEAVRRRSSEPADAETR
jgi:hypothetical protein